MQPRHCGRSDVGGDRLREIRIAANLGGHIDFCIAAADLRELLKGYVYLPFGHQWFLWNGNYKRKVLASVARCQRTPPYIAKRKDLVFGFSHCLRSESNRSIVVICNYKMTR